jgi:hypothetical protein
MMRRWRAKTAPPRLSKMRSGSARAASSGPTKYAVVQAQGQHAGEAGKIIHARDVPQPAAAASAGGDEHDGVGHSGTWVASTGNRAAGGEAQTPRLVGACERQARGVLGGGLRCLACSESPPKQNRRKKVCCFSTDTAALGARPLGQWPGPAGRGCLGLGRQGP